MSVYVLAPLAKADIFDIWSYIADDNENAADRVEQSIYDACAFVAEAPLRAILAPTSRLLRFWTLTRYPNYTVVYRPETVPLQVVARSARKRIYIASLNNAHDGLRRGIEPGGEQRLWNHLRPQKDSPPAS